MSLAWESTKDPHCYDCGGTPEDCDCEGGFVECACVRIDVDLDDARNCPVHGPNSREAREQRQREANAEAAYWDSVGEF